MSEKDFTIMHSRNMQQVSVTQRITKVLTLFITYAFLIVMALIVLFPFYWMIISSLKSLDEYRASVPTFWPRMVLISNYAEAFSTGNLGRLFLNTAYVGIVSTMLSLIITILTAFAFARLEFKGKNALFGALLATIGACDEKPSLLTFVAKLLSNVSHEVHDKLVAFVDEISATSCKFAQNKEVVKYLFALLAEKNANEEARAVKTEGANGDIVFDKVEFAYPTRPEAPILKGVSFTIPKNASVAFVGHSGCGKSTIISLLQRFYKPNAGTISLNGVDVNELNLDWYRGLLGVVNQEPVMFSGTIRENLLMGVDRAVSEEELKSVCEQALCMDFINEMPDEFETDLGATGKAVSGGQKQRLALARAILRNPAILLLDEATSALDSENQEKFLEALNGWRKSHPCTVVTVAHRLSTIVDSDMIFMCENGVVVGSGRHEELLKSCPPYADLVRGQMS